MSRSRKPASEHFHKGTTCHAEHSRTVTCRPRRSLASGPHPPTPPPTRPASGSITTAVAPSRSHPAAAATVTAVMSFTSPTRRTHKRCGMQILGNVTDSGGGWIYSPDRGKKYSVELTRLSDDKLKVIGNAGSFFSKTYTWKRAPDDVARCGETTARRSRRSPPKSRRPRSRRKPKPPPPSRPRTRSLGEAPSNSTSASMALIAAPKRQQEDVEVAAAPGRDRAVEACCRRGKGARREDRKKPQPPPKRKRLPSSSAPKKASSRSASASSRSLTSVVSFRSLAATDERR